MIRFRRFDEGEYEIRPSWLSLEGHEDLCPGYAIRAEKEFPWVTGVCNKCGDILERYDMRIPPERVINLFDARRRMH